MVGTLRAKALPVRTVRMIRVMFTLVRHPDTLSELYGDDLVG